MMNRFPPSADDQVTLANWRTRPFNKWAFHHVREVVPSADIANAPGQERVFEDSDQNLDGLTIPSGAGDLDLKTWLDQSFADGLIVLHKGKVVTRWFANGMNAGTPHILMSVSKSMLGLLAGVLVDRNDLDPDALVTDYVPEVKDTAYEGATVRNLLDMRAGVEFDEDYLLTEGPIIEYRKSTNWNPLGPGEEASDLRTFFSSLTRKDGAHEGRFHYVSPNTDLMAWVIERATARRYADLMSELLWQPMGASRSAYITVDRLGAPRAAGGMCVTTPDLARVGQLLVDDGRNGDRQVIPKRWIDDLQSGGDSEAWNTGDFIDHFPGKPISYRSKWYSLNTDAPMLFCLGIHGQYLFVDRANEIVIAKHSSCHLPTDDTEDPGMLDVAINIRDYLLG
jgi:CubicO group peptidase (beta-lactamase class C family)